MMEALDAYLKSVPGRIEKFLDIYEKRSTPLRWVLLEKWWKVNYQEDVHTALKNHPALIEKLNKMFEYDFINKKPVRAIYAQKVNVNEKTSLNVNVKLNEEDRKWMKRK